MNAPTTDLLLWLYVGLVFLAALAAMISTLPRWSRVLLLVAATGFYFVGEEVLDNVWGWPGSQALPARFVLLAAVIDEPTKQREGALYVWAQPLVDGRPTAQPRAYRLPYAKDLHALLGDAVKKTRSGIAQLGTAEPKTGGKGFLAWMRAGSDEQQIKIRDLPVPQLPEK